MHKTATALLLSGSLLAANPLSAREIGIQVTNLTNAVYFTPLLVAAHNPQTHLFELGTPASMDLQAMAEGGDTSGLVSEIEAVGGSFDANPAGGLLAPGATASTRLEIHGRNRSRLSITAMLLPTNDGFVGLDALKIPKRPGVYTYYLNGYDAGTEANDEIVNGGGAPNVPGIPADPGGNAGSGAFSTVGPDQNRTVHIHRGIVGDMDPLGGSSDLDSRVHRWQNPVARLVIRVGGRDD